MAGCGSCRASDNPVRIRYPDTSLVTIGVNGIRQMDGRWDQANFPQVPCPSPQNIFWEYQDPVLGWRGIPQSGFGVYVEMQSGTNVVLANAATWYLRNVKWLAAGTFKVRIRMACGSAFVSAAVTQVCVLPSAGPPKMIHTQASTL